MPIIVFATFLTKCTYPYRSIFYLFSIIYNNFIFVALISFKLDQVEIVTFFNPLCNFYNLSGRSKLTLT